jgi:S-adenosylmethionine decarboxylase
LHNSSPDGIHFLLEFFGCSSEELDSLSFWKKLLLKAVANSDVTMLNKHFYKFSPHGITGYLLLSASHISIHTWPEYAYVTCDVFSCGGDDNAKGIVRYIRANVCHEEMRKRRLKRGFRV